MKDLLRFLFWIILAVMVGFIVWQVFFVHGGQ